MRKINSDYKKLFDNDKAFFAEEVLQKLRRETPYKKQRSLFVDTLQFLLPGGKRPRLFTTSSLSPKVRNEAKAMNAQEALPLIEEVHHTDRLSPERLVHPDSIVI